MHLYRLTKIDSATVQRQYDSVKYWYTEFTQDIYGLGLGPICYYNSYPQTYVVLCETNLSFDKISQKRPNGRCLVKM